MFKSVLLASAALIVATPALAQSISAARISRDIMVVSSDAYAGRGITTPAEQKTIDYLSKGFAAAGFEPGGPDGKWTQEVRLRQFKVVDPKVNLAFADGAKLDLRQGEEITVSTRGSTSDVSFDKTPIVFVGYGVTAPERGWDDFKDVDVKGKIIVVLINDPDFPEPTLNTFNGKAMTYYGRWTYKYEEAARRGAAGVMIIHDADAASYGWATVKNSNTGPKFDIVRLDPSAASPKLESWISLDTAQKLFAASGQDLGALRIAARSKDFRPVELSATLNGSYKVDSTEIVTHNIIARLPGATRPQETVVLGGHWDHLGVGKPDANGDAIFNGAVDNGTGIAALLELARAFGQGPKPQRSVVLIAFTAEESGLLGSEYYASNPVYPLSKTVAGINMDALNVNGRTKDLEVTGAGQSSLEDLLKLYAAGQGRTLTPDQTPEAGFFFRSDHFPLAKRGVPMLYAASGKDMVKGGVAAGEAFDKDYVEKRYHQPDDEWSARWDLSGMVEDVTLYYQMGRALANSDLWPAWRDTSEFKAARDKTAAERK
ncbi:peptidase family M28 family protein [Asticcacaulis biprosthecium C19]|uniref:Peptidase family M28 family protein n=1 Tax=Asticcacaulis biprosthecium C19 TaxID=715226 RepID=F4QPZ8_9CAUL|nr:M28 family metallopeptidase [Asticcacaulis biprosthecium]EGF90285.1 peptidase family M28 family protein [Asticcacaulis biprosthecium C19]